MQYCNAQYMISSIYCLWQEWKSCCLPSAHGHIWVKENGWQRRVILETCVTVFLVKEEIHIIDVHAWLHYTYKNACMGATSVKWWV